MLDTHSLLLLSQSLPPWLATTFDQFPLFGIYTRLLTLLSPSSAFTGGCQDVTSLKCTWLAYALDGSEPPPLQHIWCLHMPSMELNLLPFNTFGDLVFVGSASTNLPRAPRELSPTSSRLASANQSISLNRVYY